jgi:hypothetical protein
MSEPQVLAFEYDDRLHEAATEFMLAIFHDPKLSNQASDTAISAAMAVINSQSFFQPKQESK